ncbi:MAG: hypothetical protein V2A34_10195, partial [Lentisphaerota bacterium]
MHAFSQLAKVLPEFSNLYIFILVLLTGFLVTYVLTPVFCTWLTRLGVLDLPDERRIHVKATPRGGGLAIVLGFHAACLMAYWLGFQQLEGTTTLKNWIGFLLASSVLVTTGLLDDTRKLKPWAKLAGQFLAASIMFFVG